MDKNVIVLQEIYKTVGMGITGIDDVKEKIKDNVILKEFIDAKKKYQVYKKEIESVLGEYDKKPSEINPVIKVSNNIYTDMKLMNTSDSKIVKMIMEGTNKGIIKLEEIKNNENIDDKDIKNILLELLDLFNYQITAWKKYL